MKREIIEQDVKKLFEIWQENTKKFNEQRKGLIDTYDIENIEEDEDEFSFDINGYDGRFTFTFGDAEPDMENQDSDEANDFASSYVDLLDTTFSDICQSIEKLGYLECDQDTYYTVWEKDGWKITIPNYPDDMESISIEEAEE